jgi:hypothetical protein
MGEDPKNIKVRVDTGGCMGVTWFMGWLFTLGFLHLVIPKALYAIFIWPYYLGAFFAK